MVSKAIKGYKFVFGGKSRPGIVGVKPKSGGVIDEFKSRKLKQLGRTQRNLQRQDKEVGEAIKSAQKKGLSRKDAVKGRKFQRDNRRAQREGSKLRKDILRAGRAQGGKVGKPGEKSEPIKIPKRQKPPKQRKTSKQEMFDIVDQVSKDKKSAQEIKNKMTDTRPISKSRMMEEIKRQGLRKGGKALKPVDKEKNPGLAKLPTHVRNKMGYMKKGGRVKKFPDLSGDGKVTKKDILMGRGVIKKKNGKKKFGGGKK